MLDPGFLKHFSPEDFHSKNRQSCCPKKGGQLEFILHNSRHLEDMPFICPKMDFS